MKVETIKYHQPGWTGRGTVAEYTVWAPGETVHSIIDLDTGDIVGSEATGKVRDYWSASVTAIEPDEADYRNRYLRGEALEEVLHIFPQFARDAFRKAVKESDYVLR